MKSHGTALLFKFTKKDGFSWYNFWSFNNGGSCFRIEMHTQRVRHFKSLSFT